MTNEQKNKIVEMRKQGLGYIKIGQILAVSENTIRTYCRRNGLSTNTLTSSVICKQCGVSIKAFKGNSVKKFCSSECRMLWWNTHPEKVNKEAFYPCSCQHCGKSFESYGNQHRKYCCHACYIADRYRKERDGDD